MREFLQLVWASGALLIAKSALLGIRVLVLLFIAAYGNEIDLANASFALSLAEVGRWIADFGTDLWAVRAIAGAKDSEREARLVTSALVIKAVGSLIVAIPIFLICLQRLRADGGLLGIMAAILVPPSQIAGLSISYFQAKAQIGKLSIMLIPCAATIVAILLTLLLTHGTMLALGVMTVGELCVSVMLFALVKRDLRPMRFAASMRDVLAMARACIPAAAFGIVVGVYSRIDTLVLAGFSLSALAAYTIAQRLFQPFQIAATSFSAMIYRRVSFSVSIGAPVAREFIFKELPSVLGSSIVFSLILFFGGRFLLHTIFPQYAAALQPLVTLCIVLPVIAFNSALAGLLLGYGRFWTVLSVSIADLVLTYSLMTFLVPTRLAAGSAQSLLIGGLFAGVALSLVLIPAARTGRVSSAA